MISSEKEKVKKLIGDFMGKKPNPNMIADQLLSEFDKIIEGN
jgi:hypothetical protein